MTYEEFEEAIRQLVPAEAFDKNCMELVKVEMKSRKVFVEALQHGLLLETLLAAVVNQPGQHSVLEELLKARVKDNVAEY